MPSAFGPETRAAIVAGGADARQPHPAPLMSKDAGLRLLRALSIPSERVIGATLDLQPGEPVRLRVEVLLPLTLDLAEVLGARAAELVREYQLEAGS